jgi:hypothetical protein
MARQDSANMLMYIGLNLLQIITYHQIMVLIDMYIIMLVQKTALRMILDIHKIKLICLIIGRAIL